MGHTKVPHKFVRIGSAKQNTGLFSHVWRCLLGALRGFGIWMLAEGEGRWYGNENDLHICTRCLPNIFNPSKVREPAKPTRDSQADVFCGRANKKYRFWKQLHSAWLHEVLMSHQWSISQGLHPWGTEQTRVEHTHSLEKATYTI